MTEAYPLCWPAGWPRTPERKRLWSLPGGRRATPEWSAGLDRLTGELRRLDAVNIVVSTNQPLRRDGLPYSATRRIEDPGAAVYFTRNGPQMAMAQDRYELLADNIRSLALAIEGMRQMQRHGGGHMMERAFTGFEALPPPGDDWRSILGVPLSGCLADAESAYRRLSKLHHPDRPGGTAERMAELNWAIREARADG